MPFQSEKQRRYLHANHPEIAKRWEREYANGGISNHFRKKLSEGSEDSYEQLLDDWDAGLIIDALPGEDFTTYYNRIMKVENDTGTEEVELLNLLAENQDPLNLSEGVTTLFQAKDGGRIGFQGGSGWGPGAGSPGTTSSGGNKNTGGSDRGPRDDPDRFGPVSTPKSTYTGPTHSPHTDTPEQIAGQKEIDEAKAKRDFDYETEAYIKTVLRPQQIKTLTIMDKYENKIKPTYRDKFNDLKKALKLGKNVMGATSSLFGFLSAGYALYKHYKEDKAFVNQLNKDIRTLKDMGTADFHHAVDTPVQTLEQLLTDRLNARRKKDDPGNNESPIVPIIEDIETYEQMADSTGPIDMFDAWGDIKQKQALRASLFADEDQAKVGDWVGDQRLLVNSGGLANLFRVKNNQ